MKNLQKIGFVQNSQSKSAEKHSIVHLYQSKLFDCSSSNFELVGVKYGMRGIALLFRVFCFDINLQVDQNEFHDTNFFARSS